MNEGGFEGGAFNVMLEDGTTEEVLGPWDAAWSPDLPIPHYRSVVLIEPSRSRWAAYVTETKLTELLEQFCPEAELVEKPNSVFNHKTIKRKGQELNCEHHGAVLHSETPYQNFAIRCFWVPETEEAIAEVWESGKEHRSRKTEVCSSPELAIQKAYIQADQLRPAVAVDEEFDYALFD
jgi:hypothetical protein